MDKIKTIQADRVHEQFDRVFPLLDALVVARLHAPSRISDRAPESDEFLLQVHLENPYGNRPKIHLQADRQLLLKLARHIFRTLDPVTNEQILEMLERIRELLEKRC